MARADAPTASWVSTTPLARPVVPLVATTRASPGATGRPRIRRLSPPAWPTTAVGRSRSSTAVCGGGGQPLVERQHGVAAVPGPLQGGDERGSPGQVDCHQVGHGS